MSAQPTHTFKVPRESGYIESIDKNCYFEVLVYPDRVQVVSRGGPLEPVCLDISGTNLRIEDDWSWGAG